MDVEREERQQRVLPDDDQAPPQRDQPDVAVAARRRARALRERRPARAPRAAAAGRTPPSAGPRARAPSASRRRGRSTAARPWRSARRAGCRSGARRARARDGAAGTPRAPSGRPRASRRRWPRPTAGTARTARPPARRGEHREAPPTIPPASSTRRSPKRSAAIPRRRTHDPPEREARHDQPRDRGRDAEVGLDEPGQRRDALLGDREADLATTASPRTPQVRALLAQHDAAALDERGGSETSFQRRSSFSRRGSSAIQSGTRQRVRAQVEQPQLGNAHHLRDRREPLRRRCSSRSAAARRPGTRQPEVEHPQLDQARQLTELDAAAGSRRCSGTSATAAARERRQRVLVQVEDLQPRQRDRSGTAQRVVAEVERAQAQRAVEVRHRLSPSSHV